LSLTLTKLKIETDTDKIETCNMHTLVYPTYLLRPPLAPGARIPESRNSRIETKKIENKSKD